MADRDDLNKVLEHLKGVKAKCYNIGTVLELNLETLECIKQKTSDPAQAMIQVVDEWLKLNYNCKKFGKPTWKALVKAVESPFGGDNTALAIEIAEEHRASG